MTSSIVVFGRYALGAALKAKCQQIRHQDYIGLAMRTLEFAHDQELARIAVLDFLVHAPRDPVGAGQRLQDFIGSWIEEICPAEIEQALSAVETAPRFAWQDRADLA